MFAPGMIWLLFWKKKNYMKSSVSYLAVSISLLITLLLYFLQKYTLYSVIYIMVIYTLMVILPLIKHLTHCKRIKIKIPGILLTPLIFIFDQYTEMLCAWTQADHPTTVPTSQSEHNDVTSIDQSDFGWYRMCGSTSTQKGVSLCLILLNEKLFQGTALLSHLQTEACKHSKCTVK